MQERPTVEELDAAVRTLMQNIIQKGVRAIEQETVTVRYDPADPTHQLILQLAKDIMIWEQDFYNQQQRDWVV
jgi:hypothetical protein